MKNLIWILCVLLFVDIAFAEMYNIDYNIYTASRGIHSTPIQSNYLELDRTPLSTGIDKNIRQPIGGHPGDYFWPPDAFRPKEYRWPVLVDSSTVAEKAELPNLLNAIAGKRFGDSLVIKALSNYKFDYPDGYHREAYGMFVEGDTVYVISGWLGKFISFYRVVPGDFRLSTSDFIKELGKITPLSKNLDGKEKAFHNEADSSNYLHEYIDKEGMFRVRNYLMNTVLPPTPPNSPEKYYNLIEVTKFYDKEAIP